MRDKRPVYLGTVAVVPRADFKRHFERPVETSDTALQSHLQAVLALAKAPTKQEAGAEDCAIDVFVAKHRGGETWDANVGDFGLPLFWRPAVEVISRLYALRSGKDITTIRVKKRLPWGEYFSRIFSVRGYLSFRSPFTHQDMTDLLDEALLEALGRIRSSV